MQIKGIITAMVTPFDEDQQLNFNATQKLIEKLISAGIHGLFILGSNGEFHMLTEEEKISFADFVIKTVDDRIPVYVGTGGNNTQQVIRLSKKMEALGADALSVITPYFIPPTQQELVEHYTAVAEAVSIPVILYNIPKSTGINISAESITELAKLKNIVAVKDSSGKLENMKAYIDAAKGQDFFVLTGSDSLILPALKIGAVGAVAGTSNLLTELDISIYNHFKNGDWRAAEESQEAIEKLRSVLHKGTVPSVLKKALSLSGFHVGNARKPVREPDEMIVEEIRDVLNFYQIAHE